MFNFPCLDFKIKVTHLRDENILFSFISSRTCHVFLRSKLTRYIYLTCYTADTFPQSFAVLLYCYNTLFICSLLLFRLNLNNNNYSGKQQQQQNLATYWFFVLCHFYRCSNFQCISIGSACSSLFSTKLNNNLMVVDCRYLALVRIEYVVRLVYDHFKNCLNDQQSWSK